MLCLRPRWFGNAFEKFVGSSLRTACSGFSSFLGLVVFLTRCGWSKKGLAKEFSRWKASETFTPKTCAGYPTTFPKRGLPQVCQSGKNRKSVQSTRSSRESLYQELNLMQKKCPCQKGEKLGLILLFWPSYCFVVLYRLFVVFCWFCCFGPSYSGPFREYIFFFFLGFWKTNPN